MRIWWQSSTPLDRPAMADYRSHLVAHVTSVKRPDTEIHFSGVDDGSLALDYEAVVELNSMAPGGVLHKIIQAEADGFDVVAIGCMLDPALLQARELVGIPIVSFGETTMHVACMLGDRVSGVAFSDKQAGRYTRQAYAMGLSDRTIPFGSLGIDFPTLAAAFRDPDPMVVAFEAVARRLVDQGAEVIIPACATLDLFLADARVDEVHGARVLHADATLLKMAETFGDLATLGVTTSRALKYAGPKGARREAILDTYGIRPRITATAGERPVSLSFDFTPEQDLARSTVRALLADVASVDYVRRCDLEHRPPREAFDALARDGWLGVGIPEADGGAGGSPVDVAVLLEEVGRAHLDLALWLFRNLSHGGSAIGHHGTAAQRRTYLPAIAEGRLSLAFALTEPEAGSDAAAIVTRAERDGDDYLLTGQKWYTSGFAVADLCLVVARTTRDADKREGITNFLVDTSSPGLTATRIDTLGTWSLGTYAVHLDHVRVPASNVLGTVDGGWPELREYLEMERLCLSAARVGAAAAALDEAVAYARERRQFDRPIGSFQAVAHRLADMATQIEAARWMVYRFAWLMTEDRPRTTEAAMLKLFVGETYQRVAEMGVQILGGYGYTMEAPMARHYRDAKLGTIGGGTSEIQRNIIARGLGLSSS